MQRSGRGPWRHPLDCISSSRPPIAGARNPVLPSMNQRGRCPAKRCGNSPLHENRARACAVPAHNARPLYERMARAVPHCAAARSRDQSACALGRLRVLDRCATTKPPPRAPDRPVSYVDVPLDRWQAGLSRMGLPPHTEQHVATMAQLHRDNRYDRTADGVDRVTGIPPQSIEAFVGARRDFYLGGAHGSGSGGRG